MSRLKNDSCSNEIKFIFIMERIGIINIRHIKLFIALVILIGFSVVSLSNKIIPEPETTLVLLPSKESRRKTEGDFVNLNDGRILYIYSHFYGGSSSDHAGAFLAGRFSSDGGKTWTKEDEMIIPNEAKLNIMSVSLLRLKNGDIALFYLKKNSLSDCIPQMRISKDEAKTWSEPKPVISDKKGYFVLNNDRVVQLEDGRLLAPVSLHKTPDSEFEEKGKLFCYYSDNNGQTWHSSEKVPDETDIITQEPGLIEMNDGMIMMYSRASGGFQQLSFSSDRGETWSHIEMSKIPSPISPAVIEKIPGTGDWLMVWNNHDGSNQNRTPLTIAISKDEGKTWIHNKNIETDPYGSYCYAAVHFIAEDNILISYTSSNKVMDGMGTSITLFDKAWLYK